MFENEVQLLLLFWKCFNSVMLWGSRNVLWVKQISNTGRLTRQWLYCHFWVNCSFIIFKQHLCKCHTCIAFVCIWACWILKTMLLSVDYILWIPLTFVTHKTNSDSWKLGFFELCASDTKIVHRHVLSECFHCAAQIVLVGFRMGVCTWHIYISHSTNT